MLICLSISYFNFNIFIMDRDDIFVKIYGQNMDNISPLNFIKLDTINTLYITSQMST